MTFEVGDIVEYRNPYWPSNTVVRGPLFMNSGYLSVANIVIGFENQTRLTLIQKAPKPFYTNHTREMPVDGDVAAYRSGLTHWYRIRDQWIDKDNARFTPALHSGPQFTLILDGETGKPV